MTPEAPTVGDGDGREAGDDALAAARWSAREVVHNGSLENVGQHGHAGWHVIGELGDDPDPHVREVFDLHVQYADDGDGGDCSRWLAERVARALSAASPPAPEGEAEGEMARVVTRARRELAAASARLVEAQRNDRELTVVSESERVASMTDVLDWIGADYDEDPSPAADDTESEDE